MKITVPGVAVVVVLATGLFLFVHSRNVVIAPQEAAILGNTTGTQAASGTGSLVLPEASQPTSTPSVILSAKGDLPPQPKLANPPSVVKGIYLTAWVAGSPGRVQSIINLIKASELNAVVIDLKDYSGYVSYAMDVPEVRASGALNQPRILRPNALIKEFHDNGIYVIGRITDFQDPILAKAHPEWALHNKTTGAVWEDNNHLAWMDPAATPVWDYLASIAKDALGRGFDEINFDYIRFASDGALGSISYPYWDQKSSRATVITNYFKFLRQAMPNDKISADLFGLSTINNDDLGIGQIIQSAYQYFDYVSPMVYPSHYATGFLGYKYPAAYPYQVIDYSMTHAVSKLIAMGTPPANVNSTVSSTVGGAATSTAVGTSTVVKKPFASQFDLGYIPSVKLRPWLQDFNLGPSGASGTVYTPQMINQEKQAVYDSLNTTSSNQYYGGWLMWDAANNYSIGDFAPKGT